MSHLMKRNSNQTNRKNHPWETEDLASGLCCLSVNLNISEPFSFEVHQPVHESVSNTTWIWVRVWVAVEE